MRTIDQILKELADERYYGEWWHMPYSLQASLVKDAAIRYADQFKIKLGPDRVISQKEFNKQYGHYQDLLILADALEFQAQIPDLSEDEISHAWSEWYKAG